MNFIKKVKANPYHLLSPVLASGFSKCLSDKTYLKLMFRAQLGKRLDLENPKTFNEKLQWLKLYDRRPEYPEIVDKYEAKKYVASILGEEYIIPTLGVWERFDEIDFSALPDRFVLKCTHDSGGLVICRDKAGFDIEAAGKKIEKCLKKNYYWIGREWPYKSVKPRIIAEQYMEDESKQELKDYKVLNFNGEPKLIQLDFNRFSNHMKKLYDIEWNELPFEFNYPTDRKHKFEKPKTLEKVLQIASKLSEGVPFLRTDFYLIDDKIYFGELTLFPASGFGAFKPEKWDEELGSWIRLPEHPKK